MGEVSWANSPVNSFLPLLGHAFGEVLGSGIPIGSSCDVGK